jgi:hypothetical protein
MTDLQGRDEDVPMTGSATAEPALDEARVPKGGRRDRLRSNPATRVPYRIGVFVLGLLCILVGIGLAVLPGPLTIPPVLLGPVDLVVGVPLRPEALRELQAQGRRRLGARQGQAGLVRRDHARRASSSRRRDLGRRALRARRQGEGRRRALSRAGERARRGRCRLTFGAAARHRSMGATRTLRPRPEPTVTLEADADVLVGARRRRGGHRPQAAWTTRCAPALAASTRVVVDLSECSFIDGRGLASLLAAGRQASASTRPPRGRGGFPAAPVRVPVPPRRRAGAGAPPWRGGGGGCGARAGPALL